MNTKQLPLFALLLVALTGLLWIAWPTEDGGDTDETGEVTAVGPEAPEPDAADAVADLEGGTTPEPDASRTEAVVDPAWEAAAASAPETLQSFDLAGAAWIDVSIAVPPGSPADPTLDLVVAYPRSSEDHGDEVPSWLVRQVLELKDGHNHWSDWEFARVRVGEAREVRVPRPAASTDAFFALRGKYLHLDDVRHDLTVDPEAVTLTPVLGAWLTGRFLVPPEARDRGVTHTDFQGQMMFRSGEEEAGLFQLMGPRHGNEAMVYEDLSYEVRGLSAGGTHTFSVSVDGLLDRQVDEFEVQPGEHKVLDVEFQPGASVLGRVLDEAGQGVPEIAVTAWSQGGGRSMGYVSSQNEDARTFKDGNYAVHGLPGGDVTVQVQAPGWLEPDEQRVEVEEGGRLENVDFHLQRGHHVTGLVRWTDETPAQHVDVTVYQAGGGDLDDVGRGSTGDGGRFEITGLLKGPFLVVARHTTSRKDAEPAADGPQWVKYRAEAVDVAADTEDLVLVLQEPLGLAGRVVDDTGVAVAAFQVAAQPLRNGLWPDHNNAEFENADGGFHLTGLFPGEWELSASAEGFSDLAEPLVVTVPRGDDPLVITLTRAASVSGMVVDPAGNPVAGATVAVGSGGAPFEMMYFFGDAPKSDATGRFTVEGVEPQGMVLVAYHEDWASSEEVPIEPVAGERVEEVVVRLRIGARITGEVFDEAGEPLAGQMVTVGSGMFARMGMVGGGEPVTTDTAGYFELTHVTPGKMTVSAMPSQEEITAAMEGAVGDNDEAAMLSFMSQIKSKTVEVKDGEEIHVILGAEPKDPVRVHGRVTEAGVPRTEGMVLAMAEGGALMTGMKMARIDGQGGYELTVDRPGDYVFSVGDDGMDGLGVEQYVEVPAGEDFELDLAIPSGRITGRVFDAAGDPASNVTVRVSQEGGILGIGDLDQSRRDQTAADGSYTIGKLAAGSYSLHVGGAGMFGEGDGDRYGGVIVPGIVVGSDEVVDGVDVHLSGAGKLAGIVRDAEGQPVAGASIFVRDAAGRQLSSIAMGMSEGAGKYECGGLAPGPVTVTAQKGDLTCVDQGPVTITEGETAALDLRLAAGAYLVVSLLEDGEPVRARMRVIDAEGRQVSGRFSFESLTSLMTEGISSKERTVGPLPPGEYRVIATTEDGKEAKKTVRVKEGQSKRNVKLRLK